MNDITNQNVQGINIFEIAKSPAQYPEELKSAALDIVKNNMLKILRDCKTRLELSIINGMTKDEATKLKFIGIDKEEKTLTLQTGKIDCKEKTIDKIYENNGFDPLEIGEYVFKPSWTKAKEARKLGGKKKELIDKYFAEGEKRLTIK